MSTPEAVRHIQQSFEEASQKCALDQVTADTPSAICRQLLHPSQPPRSKIPTKVAMKQTKRVGKRDVAMQPRIEPAGTHTPSKVPKQSTARKKKAVAKPHDDGQASFTSVEDASASGQRQVTDSTVHGGATPSKAPLQSSVNYDFINMSMEGVPFGVKTTVPPAQTEEATRTQLPLSSPLHAHTPRTSNSDSLSETSGVSLPRQADGRTQDRHTLHKTPSLPKAYDILADEIVSAMVSGNDRGQKSSTGHSSRYQTPEVRAHTRAHTHTHTTVQSS